MYRYRLAAIIIFLAFLLLLVVNTQTVNAENTAGEKAPVFTLKDMSGNDVALSSFRGKTVLLNFWATWCPYCRKERPHLNSLNDEYNKKGLVILSVATDRSESKIRNFIKDTPLNFPVLADTDNKVASSYHVEGLPTSFIIDSNGKIRRKLMGYREWTSKNSKKIIDRFISN